MRITHRIAGLLAGAALASVAQAAPVTAVGSGNRLVTVDSTAPGTVLRTSTITGLGAGQTLLDIDARPAVNGRVVYGLSNAGQIYAINPFTGTATAIGTPIAQVATQAVPTGIDFNPTVDRIRVVNAIGLNLRVNPDNGGVAAFDGTLNLPVNGATGPDLFGVAGAAYTNNVAGATTTVLYTLNGANGRAYIQNPPNTGQNILLGQNAAATSTNGVGFDIAGGSGEAVATFTSAAGVTSLYSVNLQSGLATLIGTFGTSGAYTGLTFTPASFASAAGTPNQIAVATAIDSYVGVPSANLLNLFSGLDTLASNTDRRTAYSRLGPNQYSILPELALQTNEIVDGTLRRYLRDVRAGGTGNTDPGATKGTDRKLGGFLVGTGRSGQFTQRGDRERVKYGDSGVIAGIDYRLSDTTLIGVAGGYDYADVGLNSVSPNSSDRTGFGAVYGTIGLGGFYVDFDGSYGKSKYYLKRNVRFGNFTNDNRARTTSRYYAGNATAGFSFEVAGLEAEAYGGARYAHVRVKGFGELGGISALTVAQQTVKSFQSIAGARLGLDYQIGGAHVRPSVRGEWRHEFDNDGSRLLTASFGPGTGISNTPITYATTPLGKDYAVVGGGLTISGNSPIAVLIDYTGQFYAGYRINSAQVGIRISM